MQKESIKIGVSSCLLGLEVRHDGGHKNSRYVSSQLDSYFEFVPFCPEMAIGLGVPRPTIRLVKRANKTHLVNSKDDSIDHTEAMRASSLQQCQRLSNVSGYILKSKSPSCGMERVNLFNEKGFPEKTGVGFFAAVLMEKFPDLPIEEEERLNDPHLRENFIDRIFTYHRWQQMLQQGLSVASLQEFHKTHKFNLLAHDEVTYREIGPLIASVNGENLKTTADEYFHRLMQAMKIHATRKKHVNVLQHAMGYLKHDLPGDDKQELLSLFDKYRLGQVPIIVPITLLKYHLRKHKQPYIAQQHYMNPYPEELMLRNHV